MTPHTRLTTPFSACATAAEAIAGTDLRGSRVVVAGGASGLGVETVRALAGAGTEVTVATRRPARAEPLARDGRRTRGHRRPRPGDLHSVEALARSRRGPLDVLVANAGVMALLTRTLSADGWELQLATNFLDHFALAEALRPALRAAGSGRLVVVGFGPHRTVFFDFEDPHFARRPYDPWTAYGQSKTVGVHPGRGRRTTSPTASPPTRSPPAPSSPDSSATSAAAPRAPSAWCMASTG